MLRIFHDTSYDFLRWWRIAITATAIVTVSGMIALAIHGVNYNIEFTGGTLQQVAFKTPPDVSELRSALDAAGIRGAEIQQFGNGNEYTIRAENETERAAAQGAVETVAQHIDRVLHDKYGDAVTTVRSDVIGPRVGAELRWKAIVAMLISFIVTLIYIAIRFEWRFGLASLIGSLHDVLLTLAFIALMRIEVSLMVVAAVLTVIGYSLNDSIIIFDRAREIMRRGSKEALNDLVNRSINETLARSIVTHTLVFAATLALLIFAGEVIRPFAWVMAFGVVESVFSSMYIAAPALIWLEKRYPRGGAWKGSSTATSTSRTQPSTATATR